MKVTVLISRDSIMSEIHPPVVIWKDIPRDHIRLEHGGFFLTAPVTKKTLKDLLDPTEGKLWITMEDGLFGELFGFLPDKGTIEEYELSISFSLSSVEVRTENI